MENFVEYTTQKGKQVIYKQLESYLSDVDIYLIGNLGYDGTFNKRNKSIVVETTDLNIPLLIKNYWNPTLEISSRGFRDSVKVKSISECYRAYLPNPLSRDLARFGIAALKADRGFYNIPKKYWAQLLAGALDAEGWWSVRYRKDCRIDRLSFGMRSSAIKLNRYIQRYLLELGISTRLYETDSMSELRIETVDEAIKLGFYIYSNCCDYVNQTKKNVFITYLQRVYLPHNRVNCGEAQTIRSQAELLKQVLKVQRLGDIHHLAPDTFIGEEIVH